MAQEPQTQPSTGGLFIAVGQNGKRATSLDGKRWTESPAGNEGEVYRAVCFGNDRFVAIGSFGGENIYASSANGVDWTTGKRDAHYSTYLRGIGFGASQFLALGGDPGSVGVSKPFVMTTSDGITWSDSKPIEGKNILRRVAYGNGIFVGVGDRGRRSSSKDGLTWQDTPNVKAIDTLIDVAFGAGVFVGVGLNGLRMTTSDGLTWSHREVGEEGEHINSILWAGDRFVGVGLGGSYSSPDGMTWKRQENHNAPLFAAWGNGVFVGTQWKGRLLHSSDAVNWTETHKSDSHFEAVTWGPLAKSS